MARKSREHTGYADLRIAILHAEVKATCGSGTNAPSARRTRPGHCGSVPATDALAPRAIGPCSDNGGAWVRLCFARNLITKRAMSSKSRSRSRSARYSEDLLAHRRLSSETGEQLVHGALEPGQLRRFDNVAREQGRGQF